MIKSKFARHIFDPLYYRIYLGYNSSKFYNFLKKAQWNSLEENQKLQRESLYELLEYASKNISYYKRLFQKNNIKLSKESVFEDIRKIPVLTKEILRKEFKNLYKTIPNNPWEYNSSGGSTGEPVTLIQDRTVKIKSRLIKKFQKEWAGYHTGETMIKLWGSERDITGEKENVKHRFTNWMNSVNVLNSFAMDSEKMQDYVKIINKKKPRLILAYAQSMYDFANFIDENKIKVHSPKSIMTSAGILYPHFRKRIEKVFRCPVFDRYGSREVGDMACECERHDGLHVMMFTHYIEILDKKLKPCEEGQVGDIYVTFLTNFTMPLIRYKIGDLATYTKKMCSCKRGMPIIKNIVGREMDVLKTKDGKFIQGEFFIHFIGVVHNKGIIEQFQVIQKNYYLIEIKVVVKDKSLFENDRKSIENDIRKVMGNIKIKWSYVKKIEASKSGKYRYTLREF